MRAWNAFGASDFSDEVEAGMSSFPSAPSAPTKVVASSGETYIALKWTQVADTELPVLGYLLQMNDGYGGDTFTTVYNGLNYPNVLTYTVTGLTSSLTY